jgi:hypothetical protein
VTDSRRLLQHFLAALAYRAQKALRDAPSGYSDYRAEVNSRTPHELMWHMSSLMGYARTMLHGGTYEPPWLPSFADEVARFHSLLQQLLHDFADERLNAQISDEQFLQGPLADAMTHVGQLAMLRRLAGKPVPPENFIYARIDSENVTAEQAAPAAPDLWWRPDLSPAPTAAQRRQMEIDS